jgi:hypothetical protein
MVEGLWWYKRPERRAIVQKGEVEAGLVYKPRHNHVFLKEGEVGAQRLAVL